jgi:hypothetical protein
MEYGSMKRNNYPPTIEEFHLGGNMKYEALTVTPVFGKYQSKFMISAFMEEGFIRDKYVLRTKNKKLINTMYYRYFLKRFDGLEKKYNIKINRVK